MEKKLIKMHKFEVSGSIMKKGGDMRDFHRNYEFTVITHDKSFTQAETTAQLRLKEIVKEFDDNKFFSIDEKVELECQPIESIQYKGAVYLNV